jgi:PAS domain S-box-containing protein
MAAGIAGSGEPIRVLYVDTDADVCRRVERFLSERATEFAVTTETDPQTALRDLETTAVDCLVSRYELGETDGVNLLKTVRSRAPDVPFVLFTDAGDEAVASQAVSAGVTDYVRKSTEEGLPSLAARIRAAASGHGDGDTDTRQPRLGRFLEAFPDVVFVIGEEGRYLDVVSSGDDALLYDDPEELLGHRFDDVLPAETADRFLRVVEEVVDTGERRRIEYPLEVQSGRRWFESQVIPRQTTAETETVFWIARDITERKRRKREYEQIFNSVRDAIAVFDPEAGRITEVNEAYRELFGYDFTTIRRLGIEGLSASEDGYTGERGWRLIRETAETGEPATVEWLATTSEGERRWLEATVTPAEINGQRRVLSIQRDITARKRRQRAIEALQAATERLEAATTPTEVATIAVEAVSDVLDRPEAVCWFHDEASASLTPVAATGGDTDAQSVSELPTGSYEYDVFLEDTVTEYTPGECVSDGPFESGVLLPLGEHGLVAAAAPAESVTDTVALDISRALVDHVTTALDRVERAQAVRESERRFRLIAERIDEVIYLANTEFTEVLYANPAYETIWGRPVEELYDDAKKFIEAIDARDRDAIEADIEAMIQEMRRGEPADSYEFEYRIRRPDGQRRWVSATGYSVEMYDDEQQFVGIVKDITERKRREQRLEVFNRTLRHNLRNQLDVIRAHAEAMAVDADPGRAGGGHAEQILTAVDELAEMGDQAREIDRIMSREADVDRVGLSALVKEVCQTVDPEPAVDLHRDLPTTAALTADRAALRTVIESALENAVDHADTTVEVTVESYTQGYDVLVDDDGPGIDEDDLAPIEAGTETSLSHGRGLGLWQLRWGVDVLEGELSFETDDGTTVRIRVPDQSGREPQSDAGPRRE